MVGRPALVATPHKVDVFYREPHDRMYVMTWQRTRHAFKAPEGGGDNVYLGSSPVVARDPISGELVGYFLGVNGHVWFTHYPDRPGGPWGSAPHDTGIIADELSVASDGIPELYLRSAGGPARVYHPAGGWLRPLVVPLSAFGPKVRWVTNIHLWPTLAPTALAYSGFMPCLCQRD